MTDREKVFIPQFDRFITLTALQWMVGLEPTKVIIAIWATNNRFIKQTPEVRPIACDSIDTPTIKPCSIVCFVAPLNG